MTVRPFEEPAYVIERFSSAATAAGLQMNVETMLAALEWFCARRSCHRPITGPHRFVVNGVGNITVRPFQDPAAVVERIQRASVGDGLWDYSRCYAPDAVVLLRATVLPSAIDGALDAPTRCGQRHGATLRGAGGHRRGVWGEGPAGGPWKWMKRCSSRF